MARTEADLLNLGLPKWPQHYVTGAPVTVEQAKEIIRRTDSFFVLGFGGNNHQYDTRVRALVGMPPDSWDAPREPELKADATEEEKRLRMERIRAHWEQERLQTENFRRRWRTISTEYVHNSWVSSAFVYGPHGWCHPDGQIGFVDNIGKYPSIAEVLSDWKVLAEAFPFLDVGVTLFNGESCEENISPIVSLRVRESVVELIDPTEVNVHALHPKATRRGGATDDLKTAMGSLNSPWREQGISDEWVEEWAKQYGPKAPRSQAECMMTHHQSQQHECLHCIARAKGTSL